MGIPISEQAMNGYPTVADIQVIQTRGPWQSKSGGILEVQFALPQEAAQAFFWLR